MYSIHITCLKSVVISSCTNVTVVYRMNDSMFALNIKITLRQMSLTTDVKNSIYVNDCNEAMDLILTKVYVTRITYLLTFTG